MAAGIMVTSFRRAFVDLVSPETMDACANPENCRAVLPEARKQIGNRPVYLWVFKQNTRARRFYEKSCVQSDTAFFLTSGIVLVNI